MNKTNNKSIRQQKERAAGIDIHKNKAVVCFYIAGTKEVIKDYGTFTEDFEKIGDDLLIININEVIIESTGIYWIAITSLLTKRGFNVTVVNPKFIKNIPKEKTDKQDARWLCKLLVNGLVRGSFVASEEQRAFRDLCRMRSKYRNHITQSMNRIVKNLERRNIKLRSIVSNMKTKTAMDIVNSLAQGETDLEKLLCLCQKGLKKKKEEFGKALNGVLTNHDREMLQDLLNDMAHYKKQIKKIDKRIKLHTSKVNQELIANLKEISGVGQQTTEIILAEIGNNVDVFANEDKLAAWVGLAPGNRETGGRAYYVGKRDGNVYLQHAMIQSAWSAVRCKNSYWSALYFHLHSRMHSSKAIVAVARKLIRIIYKIIKGTIKYTELGGDYFNQRLKERLHKSLT